MDDESTWEDDLSLSDVESQWDDRYWSAEELGLVEPPDDIDRDVEWIGEPSPEELWELYLAWEPESDRIQQLVDALVALGCKQVELLPAVVRLKNAYWCPLARRSELLEHADRIAAAKGYLSLLVGNELFSNADGERLRDLLEQREQQLRLQAEHLKRNPHFARRQALIALLQYVNRATREPRYQILSELLRRFVDESLTEANLRQYASRAGLPKARASKPQLPGRRPTTKGRKVDLSGHAKGRRVHQAKANAGLDRWNDDEGEWN